MKFNKHNISLILLVLGMLVLMIGFSTDDSIYSYIAIVLVLISLVLGWRRPGRRR